MLTRVPAGLMLLSIKTLIVKTYMKEVIYSITKTRLFSYLVKGRFLFVKVHLLFAKYNMYFQMSRIIWEILSRYSRPMGISILAVELSAPPESGNSKITQLLPTICLTQTMFTR